MEKLYQDICKEIDCIEEQGLSASNIDLLFKLVDIKKDILELEEKEGKEEDYMIYNRYYDERDMSYSRGYRGRDMYRDSYRRGGNGIYGHFDERFYERLDRIAEAMDDYMHGRDRYHDNGSQDRMEEGLEKVMYGICTLVESIVDFAETPEEKEIVRKHIDKIKNI